MNNQEFFVLVVDDQIDICKLIQETIEEDLENVKVLIAHTKEEAKKVILNQKIDLVLLDIWLENQNDGIEFLEEMKKSNYDFLVVMISGHGNLGIAVKSIKIGAYDYIEKPFPAEKLKKIVKNALDFQKLQKIQNEKNSFFNSCFEIAGESKFAFEMKDFIKKFSKSQSRILIYGEKGSGKEFFARLIHKNSENLNKGFKKIQASDEIILNNFNLEDLNFSGTLFFDKIEKFPLYFQKSLLVFINKIQFNLNNNACSSENYQFPRIIISSSLSQKNLEDESRNGRFNLELFNRINVLTIELQPLRKRIKDLSEIINVFSNFFQKTYNLRNVKFSEDALIKLSLYDWPGNFSELKNLIELILIRFENENQNKSEIPGEFIHHSFFFNYKNSFLEFLVKIEEVFDLQLKEARDLFEKKYILMNLKRFEGSITKTAEFIGMDRSALHRKLKILEIDCAF